ncbi:MAG: WYL domain-containing protein [Acidobacteria bacterium]|nr:WYL domain-containing protein [Acidobacteriota bacterium]
MSAIPPSSPPSYSSAKNLMTIVHLLHASPLGLSVDEIESRLSISHRTFLRYLAILEETLFDDEGQPLVEQFRYSGGSRIRFRRKPVGIQGQAYQLMSLFMAMELMGYLEGTVFHQGATEVIQHFSKVVQHSHSHQSALLMKDFQKKFVHVSDAPKEYKSQGPILERLVEALVLQRWVQVEYQALNKPAKSHRLAPLSLLLFRRGLYLIGRSDLNKPEITLAVERIQALSMDKQGFAYPEDYEPRSRFEHQFGLMGGDHLEQVTLRFDAGLKPLLASRLWHPSQRFEEVEQGLLMHLEVFLTEELIAFILGFGPQLVVLKPIDLRQTIHDRLQSALNHYNA